MNRNVMITCALTGAGDTVGRSEHVPVTPEQIACPVCGEEHVGRLVKRPKSRAGRRWATLAAPARDALGRHRKRQKEERDWLGKEAYRDHGLVLCLLDGIPPRPGGVTEAFEGHVRACGLPVIRLHDTRHGACFTAARRRCAH